MAAPTFVGTQGRRESFGCRKTDPMLVDQTQAAVYKCPVCKGLLVKPLQASCGHRFCSPCVSELFRKQQPLCPEDKAPLIMEEIHRDISAERQVQSLEVCCSLLSDDGRQCTWLGELHHLQVHEAECSFATVTCPNHGCQEMLQHQKLPHHLQNSCQYHTIPCLHCCMSVPAIQFEQHRTECVGEDLQQQLQAMTIHSVACRYRHRAEGDGLRDCEIPCQFCKKLVPQISMKDHENICPECPTWCPNGCESKQFVRREGPHCDLAEHEKASQDYHHQLFLKSQVNVLSEKCTQLEQQVSCLLSAVERPHAVHDSQLTESHARQDLRSTILSTYTCIEDL